MKKIVKSVILKDGILVGVNLDNSSENMEDVISNIKKGFIYEMENGVPLDIKKITK